MVRSVICRPLSVSAAGQISGLGTVTGRWTQALDLKGLFPQDVAAARPREIVRLLAHDYRRRNTAKWRGQGGNSLWPARGTIFRLCWPADRNGGFASASRTVSSAADLKFVHRKRRVRSGTSNRKAALESLGC